MPEVAEYLDEFEELTYKKRLDLDPAIFEAYAKKKFISWFERRVTPYEELHEKFKDIIKGPFQRVNSYPGCKCNGYKFLSSEPGEHTSPNSGVYVEGTCYNEVSGNYFGRLEEVVKLTYRNGHNIMLLKCHWFDSTRNVKVDKHRMTIVNVKSQLDAEDVFVLASQAVQIYYAPNINTPNSPWYTVVTTKNPPLNESTSSPDDALQQEESNASSSHVEPVIIDDPENFFIDLRNIGTNYEHVQDDEENVPEQGNSSVDKSSESDEDSS